MPEYTIKIREYDFTQYEGEEPDKDFVRSFTRRVLAKSIADAMEMGQEIINELNARQEVVAHEADRKWDIPAYRSWKEFRFELEVPLSPKYIR